MIQKIKHLLSIQSLDLALIGKSQKTLQKVKGEGYLQPNKCKILSKMFIKKILFSKVEHGLLLLERMVEKTGSMLETRNNLHQVQAI